VYFKPGVDFQQYDKLRCPSLSLLRAFLLHNRDLDQ